MNMKDIIMQTAVFGGGSGGGYPEPTGSITITENGTHNVKDKATAVVNVPTSGGMIDVPTGYTLKENARKLTLSSISAVKLNSNYSAQVDVTTADTIAAQDKICLHSVYASSATATSNYGDIWIWGTVSSKSGTSSSYRNVSINVAGFIVQPSSNQTKSISANGTFGTVGYTAASVNTPGAYVNLTGVTFDAMPLQYGTVTFNSWDMPVSNSDAVIYGIYDSTNYIIQGSIVTSTGSTITVMVNTVVAIVGSGYQYVTGVEYSTEPVAGSSSVVSISSSFSQGDNVVMVGTYLQNTYIVVGQIASWWGTSGMLSCTAVYQVGGGSSSGGGTIITGIETAAMPLPYNYWTFTGNFESYNISVGDYIYVEATVTGQGRQFIVYGLVRTCSVSQIEVYVHTLYNA